VASQAAVYVHAIAMLHERAATLTRDLSQRPDDPALRAERAGVRRSLRLFRSRLRRTEEAAVVGAARR
jgi:HD-like signal output (HDOD) protein